MKILFINISDTQGGSAKAAYRLGKCLEEKYNTENLFLVRTKRSDDKNVIQTRRSGLCAHVERVVNIIMNTLGFQYYWLPFSPRFILKKAEEYKPDVISLQNTLGGYFKTKDLIKLSKIAPVVWTLHDMWAFTRNASYTFGDNSWKQKATFRDEHKIFPELGFNNGTQLLRHKEKVYSSSEFSLITPSKWLAELVRISPLLRDKEVHHVFNGIDLNLFKPFEKTILREKYNIAPDQKVIVFIAENLAKKNWKLGNELKDILAGINNKLREKVTLVILGNGYMPYLTDLHNYDIILQGYVYEDRKISELLALSDIFIYPTREDNLPTVLIESLACGTPCITFDTGGCGEIIINDLNGILIEKFNTNRFSNAAINLLENESVLNRLSINARNYAEENFSVEKMADSYMKIFTSLVK